MSEHFGVRWPTIPVQEVRFNTRYASKISSHTSTSLDFIEPATANRRCASCCPVTSPLKWESQILELYPVCGLPLRLDPVNPQIARSLAKLVRAVRISTSETAGREAAGLSQAARGKYIQHGAVSAVGGPASATHDNPRRLQCLNNVLCVHSHANGGLPPFTRGHRSCRCRLSLMFRTVSCLARRECRIRGPPSSSLLYMPRCPAQPPSGTANVWCPSGGIPAMHPAVSWPRISL
jgi:hypothetical protein